MHNYHDNADESSINNYNLHYESNLSEIVDNENNIKYSGSLQLILGPVQSGKIN